MIRFATVFAAAGLVFAWSIAPAAAQITIPTVTIGNPGNAPDTSTGLGIFGAVPYTFNISKYEVTNAQFAAFLNAKAASNNLLGLYNTNMNGTFGGIRRSGTAGSYSYQAIPGRENNPVNWVSFWDAARFVNWLHNGQGNGDTETGAYTITSSAISLNTVTRNPGWRWAVTSEDEWFKAAYYQPARQGGDVDDYWLYATSSNDAPTTDQANFDLRITGSLTPVGMYEANASGAFDMGGNVIEWTEGVNTLSDKVLRGGSFEGGSSSLRADSRLIVRFLTTQDYFIGFRVSQFICRADFNGLDGVNVQDTFDFLAAWFASDPRADFNAVNGITVQDIFDFLAAWFQGCN